MAWKHCHLFLPVRACRLILIKWHAVIVFGLSNHPDMQQLSGNCALIIIIPHWNLWQWIYKKPYNVCHWSSNGKSLTRHYWGFHLTAGKRICSFFPDNVNHSRNSESTYVFYAKPVDYMSGRIAFIHKEHYSKNPESWHILLTWITNWNFRFRRLDTNVQYKINCVVEDLISGLGLRYLS